jgi:hypothetical protein
MAEGARQAARGCRGARGTVFGVRGGGRPRRALGHPPPTMASPPPQAKIVPWPHQQISRKPPHRSQSTPLPFLLPLPSPSPVSPPASRLSPPPLHHDPAISTQSDQPSHPPRIVTRPGPARPGPAGRGAAVAEPSHGVVNGSERVGGSNHAGRWPLQLLSEGLKAGSPEGRRAGNDSGQETGVWKVAGLSGQPRPGNGRNRTTSQSLLDGRG